MELTLSEVEMSDRFGERLAVVETTTKHTEKKLDDHGEHLESISKSMAELAKVVVTQNNHHARLTHLESSDKDHEKRIDILEKYKIKVVAAGAGAAAILYISAPELGKIITQLLK